MISIAKQLHYEALRKYNNTVNNITNKVLTYDNAVKIGKLWKSSRLFRSYYCDRSFPIFLKLKLSPLDDFCNEVPLFIELVEDTILHIPTIWENAHGNIRVVCPNLHIFFTFPKVTKCQVIKEEIEQTPIYKRTVICS